jgi:hypothetical protein
MLDTIRDAKFVHRPEIPQQQRRSIVSRCDQTLSGSEVLSSSEQDEAECDNDSRDRALTSIHNLAHVDGYFDVGRCG